MFELRPGPAPTSSYFSDEKSELMLEESEINRYREEGYLVFERLMSEDRVAYFTSVLDELVEQARSLEEEKPHWTLEYDGRGNVIPGVLHKVQGVCEVEPRVLELAGEAAILDRVEALLGSDIDVFGTKFFPKLIRGSVSTHWHQDNFYFDSRSDQIVSCGIYLEETDRENGCLRILPRSHKEGIKRHERDVSTHGSWTEIDEAAAIDVVAPAGTVVFFSANLVHGAYDNASDRSRYSTAWHYLPGDFDLRKFRRGEYKDRYIVRR